MERELERELLLFIQILFVGNGVHWHDAKKKEVRSRSRNLAKNLS